MSLGLLLTALALGLRHGIDWDHVAAIADLSGSASTRRRGFVLSMIYSIGHGAVVFGLGLVALIAGTTIPAGFDTVMTRIVGVTLLALGAWILFDLYRSGSSFRLRSRWMLILDGTFAGFRRVRAGIAGRRISIEHEHPHRHGSEDHDVDFAHDHSHESESARVATRVAAGRMHTTRQVVHSHHHAHDLLLPEEARASYGGRTAVGIGMLHGIGIESPTQIAIFVASTAAAGAGLGIALLTAWVIGLVVANAGLALVAGAGLLHAEKSYPIYASLAVAIGASSLAMGALYLAGIDMLPALN